MLQRTITTIGLWSFITLLLYFFGLHAGAWLIAVVSLFTLLELYLLLENMGYQPYRRAGLISGSIIVLGSYYLPLITGIDDLGAGTDLLALSVVILSMSILGKTGFNKKMRTLIPTLFGILYIPFSLHFLICIAQAFGQGGHSDSAGLLVVIWIVIVCKFTDVGGLIIGKRWGKNKMAPTISPGKTWEGTAGGIVLSAICGALFVLCFGSHLPANFHVGSAFLISIPIAMMAVASDLVESAIKRRAHVKDSGNMVPGIGGFFDLTDSLILTAPLSYLLLKYSLL